MEREGGLDLEAVQQQRGQEVLWWCIQGPHLTRFPSGLCVCEGDVSSRPSFGESAALLKPPTLMNHGPQAVATCRRSASDAEVSAGRKLLSGTGERSTATPRRQKDHITHFQLKSLPHPVQ